MARLRRGRDDLHPQDAFSRVIANFNALLVKLKQGLVRGVRSKALHGIDFWGAKMGAEAMVFVKPYKRCARCKIRLYDNTVLLRGHPRPLEHAAQTARATARGIGLLDHEFRVCGKHRCRHEHKIIANDDRRYENKEAKPREQKSEFAATAFCDVALNFENITAAVCGGVGPFRRRQVRAVLRNCLG